MWEKNKILNNKGKLRVFFLEIRGQIKKIVREIHVDKMNKRTNYKNGKFFPRISLSREFYVVILFVYDKI